PRQGELLPAGFDSARSRQDDQFQEQPEQSCVHVLAHSERRRAQGGPHRTLPQAQDARIRRVARGDRAHAAGNVDTNARNAPYARARSVTGVREHEDDGAIDLRLLLLRVWSGRWWIVACAALGAVIAVVVALTTTPVYRASAVLIPASAER